MREPRTDRVVYVQHANRFLKLRLIIETAPPAVVRQRIRRKKQDCQRKGRACSATVKLLASVNTYLTNASPQHLPSQWCRLLYAIRWQIELIFKLWKSNFALERVAGMRKERVLCTLYAKLLCIFVSSKLVFWARNLLWNTRKQELSEFRAVKVLQTFLPHLPQLLVLAPARVSALLHDAMAAMLTHCIKCPQTTRRYPLGQLDEAFP
jgi:IS4 transposase